jgi:anti-sigma regulatory factor (Ser/Thr protein kinase)
MRPQQLAPHPRAQGPVSNGSAAPLELRLAAGLNAPAAARAAVPAWLADHLTAPMLTDVELLVGELVANSVRHADAPADALVSVRVHVETDAVRLEVWDAGSSGLIARREPDLKYGGGFGLNLVEELSRRWGVSRDSGTQVWAELAFREAG